MKQCTIPKSYYASIQAYILNTKLMVFLEEQNIKPLFYL